MKILISESDDYSEDALQIYKNLGEVVADKKLNREELLEKIKDVDILVIRLMHKIDKEIIDAAKKLKIIACNTTGLDHIDIDYANIKSIQVISLKGETEFLNTITATAELAWGLLLSLVRNVPAAFNSVKAGNWNRDKFKGVELRNKTLGIVGCGRLGTMLARYGKAFFMNVIACDLDNNKTEAVGVEAVSLDGLLKKSDFISIHVPLNEKTENLIGEREFEIIKNGVYIINTSRGKIIDEKALVNALKNKKIAGVALDVLANEDADGRFLKDNPLLRYAKENDNLLLVPHIGGATYDSMQATEVFVAEKVKKYFY